MIENENDILRRVRKIEIKTRGLSNEIFAGKYHTAFRGRGMSFSEVRAVSYTHLDVYKRQAPISANWSPPRGAANRRHRPAMPPATNPNLIRHVRPSAHNLPNELRPHRHPSHA